LRRSSRRQRSWQRNANRQIHKHSLAGVVHWVDSHQKIPLVHFTLRSAHLVLTDIEYTFLMIYKVLDFGPTCFES